MKKIIKKHKRVQTTSQNSGKVLRYIVGFSIVLTALSIFVYISALQKIANSNLAMVKGISSTGPNTRPVVGSGTPPFSKGKPRMVSCRPMSLSPTEGDVVQGSTTFSWKLPCASDTLGVELRIVGGGMKPIVLHNYKQSTYQIADSSAFRQGKRYQWVVGTCMKARNPFRKDGPTITTGPGDTQCPNPIWSERKTFFWGSKPVWPTHMPRPSIIRDTERPEPTEKI